MESWTTTTYKLGPTDHPLVVRHRASVTLHWPGYCGDGRGFSLELRPEHLPELRDAVAMLEDLLGEAATRAREPEEAACPGTPSRNEGAIPDHVMRRLTTEVPDVF